MRRSFGASTYVVAGVGEAEKAHLLRKVRLWLWIFIVGLALSGITAFPLVHEVKLLVRGAIAFGIPARLPDMFGWLVRVRDALVRTAAEYPFLAYGTDWLGFAHLVIATAFVGPLRDPVRNRWVFTFGLIGCAGVVPLALIAGSLRGIPVFWQMVDCSFGIFGCLPLLLCLRYVSILETMDGRFAPRRADARVKQFS
jgi:hypothetical protein